MFKYNDLQGIAGFFSGNAQVVKFIISQARTNQKILLFTCVITSFPFICFSMEDFTAQQRKWQLFTDFEYNSTTLLQKYIVNSVLSSFGEK